MPNAQGDAFIMETIGLILFVVVVVGGYLWMAVAEEMEREVGRREWRMMKKADRVNDDLAWRRRMMYAKMYKAGRLYDIMDENQVEDFVDDFFGP